MQKALSNGSRGGERWNLALALAVVAVALTLGCGGNSSNITTSTTSNPAPGASLQKITITPASPILLLAQSRQLTARGTYSDGSTQDISSSVTWSASSSSSSSTSNFVSVSSKGLATATGLGTGSITASLGSVTGVLTLIVSTNGFSSGVMAVLSIQQGSSVIDVGYLPQQTKVNGGYAVQEVNLDADQLSSLLPVPVALISSVAMPAGYVPNAAAASQTSGLVAVISYTSPKVQVIDASNEPGDLTNNTVIATYQSPVSQSVTINGTSCMICAAVVNPLNNQLILSTAQGFYSMDLSTGAFTQIPFNPAPAPSANITVDPVAAPDPFILSTASNAGEIQILDLTTNAVVTYANIGVTPASGIVDLVTQFSAVADGSTGDQTLIDFTHAQSPVITTVTGVGVCPAGPAYMNMAALGVSASNLAANASHFVLTGQTGGSCLGVAQWPIGGSGGGNALEPGNIFYGFGPLPSTPDGKGFVSDSDPNAIATFTSVFDKNLYGLLINNDQQWLAKVNFGFATILLGNWETMGGPVLPAGSIFVSPPGLSAGIVGDPIIFLPTPSTQLTVSQSVLNFGTVAVGTPSQQLSVTLANIGQAVVNPQISVQGANAGDFSLFTNCQPQLQPLTNCGVTVTFIPTASGARSAALSVSASGEPTQTVQLSGTGS